MSQPGFFITFEGGEGVGKTTQQAILARQLESMGYTCCCTKEPGGTDLGQLLRSVLLHEQDLEISHQAELLLYSADRAEHITQIIQPALDQGHIVISDRYTDSTLAYQGYGRGLDLELIETLNHIATQGLYPDLTLWLDLPIEEGLMRIQTRILKQARLDRIEQNQLDFHHRLYQGFQQQAHKYPHRIHPVNAQGSIEEVAERIKHIVLPLVLQQVTPWS